MGIIQQGLEIGGAQGCSLLGAGHAGQDERK